MESVEMAGYKSALQAKEADLVRSMRNRGDIAIEKTPDLMEDVQLAADRELAIHNLHLESKLLRQVRAALRRIEDGTYGVCLHCEEPIKRKRLNALPWAAYCVACQELVDRNEIDTVETAPRSLAETAEAA